MGKSQKKYEIRAQYDDQLIAVYAAFGSSIADIAIKQQQLLPPFSYSRMTWIKPSYVWLMYRSDWGRRAGMERILRIWIKRTSWDSALEEAVLTTPEAHVYPEAKKWRKLLAKARIRVQWDPERNIRNEKLAYKSIQVGIMPELSEPYAKKWIEKIDDFTELTHRIRSLVDQQRWEEAEALLPVETVYRVNHIMARKLGMD